MCPVRPTTPDRHHRDCEVSKIMLTVITLGAGCTIAVQRFDPHFIFSLPAGRIPVMGGRAAVQAIFCTQLEKLTKDGKSPDEATLAEISKVPETYDHELDAKHPAARGRSDSIVTPENLRNALKPPLETCLHTDTAHVGAFVLAGKIPTSKLN